MQTGKWGASWSVALIVLAAVAAGATSLPGQNAGETQVPQLPAIDKSWPEVNVNVFVLDRQGAPQNIDEHQLQLFEDGAGRPLEFRDSPDSPVSLGFIIDGSGSMYGRLGSIAAVVHAIVRGLPNGSEVMAVSFNEIVYLDLPFAPAAEADLSFLGQLDSRGRTALYDAIVVTEKYFAAHARYRRRAMVLLSDGGDNSSQSQESDAVRSMQWPGAPAFCSFILPDTEVSGVETRHGRVAMESLAKAGGGLMLAPKAKDFMSAVTRLADIIRSQYVLHFTAADPARNGKTHNLEVRLPIKDVQIHALPVYYAPAK